MAETPAELVARHLQNAGTAWSVGVYGAVAEFFRDADEAAEITDDSVATERGALRLALDQGADAFAYETLSPRPGRWTHAVALCVAGQGCTAACRSTLTELGPDGDAVREQERAATLFDLGIGNPCVQVCVRVSEPAELRCLRGSVGRPLFGNDSTLLAELAAMSPQRVFITPLGRIEVYGPIARPGAATDHGPHTHLLPELLKGGRNLSGNAPLPRGCTPCAEFYPPHPLRGLYGEDKPFVRAQHDDFQAILAAFGDAETLAAKKTVTEAVRAGLAPADAQPLLSRKMLNVRRIALRQLRCTEPESDTLTAWCDAFDPLQL